MIDDPEKLPARLTIVEVTIDAELWDHFKATVYADAFNQRKRVRESLPMPDNERIRAAIAAGEEVPAHLGERGVPPKARMKTKAETTEEKRMKRISDAERVEAFFMAAKPDEAKLSYDRVTLILRTRGVVVPVKRAKKQKEIEVKAPTAKDAD